MADKKYDNTNRFSLWSRDKGPVTFSGIINVNGADYALKFLRLAKEGAKGYLLVEDKDNGYQLIGGGPLYDSKFEEMFLSGKIEVRGTEYYVNFYKSGKSGEKAPVFNGNIKPVDGESTSSKSQAEEGDDDW